LKSKSKKKGWFSNKVPLAGGKKEGGAITAVSMVIPEKSKNRKTSSTDCSGRA